MKRLSSLLLALFLAACSGQAIQPSYYLLRSDTPLASRQLNPDPTIAMGEVSVAPYLDQSGLQLETGSGEIRAAQHHLWAEPLYESVRPFLMTEISRSLEQDILPTQANPDARLVHVHIDQLHGTSDGDARLVAHWWISAGQEVVASHQFAENIPLASGDYAALAAAEKTLLSRLAGRIADSLRAKSATE